MAELGPHQRLAQLQREIDSNILCILSFVKYVALYEFDPAANIWHKKNTEGPLYIVEKVAIMPYQLIIVNKNSNEHFVKSLKHSVTIKKAEQNIWIFKDPDSSINYGVWSKSEQDLDSTFGKIQDLIDKCAPDVVPATQIFSIDPSAVAPPPGLKLPMPQPASPEKPPLPVESLPAAALFNPGKPILKAGFEKVTFDTKPENKSQKARELILKLADDEEFLAYIAKFLP